MNAVELIRPWTTFESANLAYARWSEAHFFPRKNLSFGCQSFSLRAKAQKKRQVPPGNFVEGGRTRYYHEQDSRTST